MDKVYKDFNKIVKGIIPSGFTHHYTCSSIKNIFNKIDVLNRNCVDIGSGQGYILYALQEFEARSIVGIEMNESCINYAIPMDSFKHNVSFKFGDFLKMDLENFFDSMHVIFNLIGTLDTISVSMRYFKLSSSADTLILLKPTKSTKLFMNSLKEDAIFYNWCIVEQNITLSGSGERRKVLIIRKPINFFCPVLINLI
jgi:SAM-dependent methyltransferase